MVSSGSADIELPRVATQAVCAACMVATAPLCEPAENTCSGHAWFRDRDLCDTHELPAAHTLDILEKNS